MMDCENLPLLKLPMKPNVWKFLPCHSPGPVEHMGIVGICPHLILVDMYIISTKISWIDCAINIGLSPLDLKMFRWVFSLVALFVLFNL